MFCWIHYATKEHEKNNYAKRQYRLADILVACMKSRLESKMLYILRFHEVSSNAGCFR